jgi:hypothetical protein
MSHGNQLSQSEPSPVRRAVGDTPRNRNVYWQRHLQQAGPMTSGLAIQATTNLRSLPIAPWAGLGVLAA